REAYAEPDRPLRAAATTRETFAVMGRLGLPIFAGVGSAVMSDVDQVLQDYRTAWREAGHAGDGDVILRLPIYVGNTTERALAEHMESTMHHYTRLRHALQRSASTTDGEARALRADRLATLTYADVVRERVVFGTPHDVVKRLQTLRDTLGLSGFIMES